MDAEIIEILESSPIVPNNSSRKRRKSSLQRTSSYETLPDLTKRGYCQTTNTKAGSQITNETTETRLEHRFTNSGLQEASANLIYKGQDIEACVFDEPVSPVRHTVTPASELRATEIIDLKSSPPAIEPVSFVRSSARSLSPAAKKAKKVQEREETRRAKEKDKALKAAERQQQKALASANKLRKSKKDCTPEMIVEVSKSIAKTALCGHLEELLGALGTSLSLSEEKMPGIVTLKRKVTATYNAEADYWQPLREPVIKNENITIVIIKAQQFELIASDPQRLAQHVCQSKGTNESMRLVYIIEGIQALIRRHKKEQNRAYSSSVREGTSLDNLDIESLHNVEDTIEDALLELQLKHNCKIVHTTAPIDTAEQVAVLITDISTIPYKVDKLSTSGEFCTDVGQIKTGDDQQDTMMKMLQQCRLTQPAAQAITSKYNGLPSLLKALDADPECLAVLPKGFNGDYSQSGQTLGKVMSLRVWKALAPRNAQMEA